MEPDEAREAEKTDRDSAKGEDDGKGQASHDAVSDEHVPATRVLAAGPEAVVTATSTASKNVSLRASLLALHLLVVVVIIVAKEVWTSSRSRTAIVPPAKTRVGGRSSGGGARTRAGPRRRRSAATSITASNLRSGDATRWNATTCRAGRATSRSSRRAGCEWIVVGGVSCR